MAFASIGFGFCQKVGAKGQVLRQTTATSMHTYQCESQVFRINIGSGIGIDIDINIDIDFDIALLNAFIKRKVQSQNESVCQKRVDSLKLKWGSEERAWGRGPKWS